MSEWWAGLSTLGRAFFGGAIFFSTVFVWQFAASLAGLGGDQGDVGRRVWRRGGGRWGPDRGCIWAGDASAALDSLDPGLWNAFQLGGRVIPLAGSHPTGGDDPRLSVGRSGHGNGGLFLLDAPPALRGGHGKPGHRNRQDRKSVYGHSRGRLRSDPRDGERPNELRQCTDRGWSPPGRGESYWVLFWR